MPPAGRVDRAGLERRLEGDRERIREVIGCFQADWRQEAAKVHEAAARGDGEALATSAHGLKGMLAMVGLVQAQGLAQSLEARARGGDLQGAPDQVSRLEAEVTQGLRELRRLAGP